VRERFSYQAHFGRLEASMPEKAAAEASGPREVVNLDADTVYKVEIALAATAESRGTVRGTSELSGLRVFELTVAGETHLSTFVETDEADRIAIGAHPSPGEPPFALSRVKVRRRAERALPKVIELTEHSVSAALATYPARREVAPEVIDTLIRQVDRL
jgi:hypothetical protein